MAKKNFGVCASPQEVLKGATTFSCVVFNVAKDTLTNTFIFL